MTSLIQPYSAKLSRNYPPYSLRFSGKETIFSLGYRKALPAPALERKMGQGRRGQFITSHCGHLAFPRDYTKDVFFFSAHNTPFTNQRER